MASPLAQFEIKTIIPLNLFDYDVSFTNSSLTMILSLLTVILFLYLGIKKAHIIPGKIQSLVELSYEFISGMINDNIG